MGNIGNCLQVVKTLLFCWQNIDNILKGFTCQHKKQNAKAKAINTAGLQLPLPRAFISFLHGGLELSWEIIEIYIAADCLNFLTGKTEKSKISVWYV